jgi:hypothetical protein
MPNTTRSEAAYWHSHYTLVETLRVAAEEDAATWRRRAEALARAIPATHMLRFCAKAVEAEGLRISGGYLRAIADARAAYEAEVNPPVAVCSRCGQPLPKEESESDG